MDPLKEALGRVNQNNEGAGSGNEPEDREEQTGGGGGGLHSVHHLNHGDGKHSVHKVHDDGKAESSMHSEGEDKTCPLCGQPMPAGGAAGAC